jgi:AcrR family transcriptional regulator
VDCAIGLFSKSGYFETSMRDIADAVGIQPGSIYNHFASKDEILRHILGLYDAYVGGNSYMSHKIDRLCENPSIENFFECLTLDFPGGEEEKYRKMLHIILHEQHRNEPVRAYMAEKFMIRNEQYVRLIVDRLAREGHIEPVDSDIVAKLHVATVYYWSNADMLGLELEPQFLVKNSMVDTLRSVYGKYLVFREARQARRRDALSRE